ncbi:MAG: glycosyltransferase family 9 protein [Calditrichae bacterium]|nr:glycosyltransferase family 9 protein [Calditrichia bacterium]
MNILIIRFSSIGDILLTTPFVRQVKNKFPDAHLTYVTKQEFAPLLKYNPYIDDLMLYDASTKLKGLYQLRDELSEKKLKYIFDLHNNLRSSILVKNLSGTLSKIRKNKFKRAILVYLKWNLYREIKPVSVKYMDVGSGAGIRDDGKGLELFLRGEKNDIFQENNLEKEQYICVAPAAAHYTKIWPLEYVKELLIRITQTSKLKVAILGSKSETILFKALPETENIIHLAGKMSLLQSAQIIKYSKGIISNDSGLMHMASALNKPIVAIFGSTVKELGFFPFRAESTIIQNDNLWCRPCSHIGREKCPLSHFKCMREITVDTVYNTVKRKFINQ